MDKQVVNLTIFLIKDHIQELKDCMKSPHCLSHTNIKASYGLEGIIYYCDSKKKPSHQRVRRFENYSVKWMWLLMCSLQKQW